MEVVEALPEHSGFVVILYADTLPRMKSAEAPLQIFDDVLVHKTIGAVAKRRIVTDWPAAAKPLLANPAAGATVDPL